MVTKLQEKYFGAPGEKFVAQHHGFDRDFWAGASNSPTTVFVPSTLETTDSDVGSMPLCDKCG